MNPETIKALGEIAGLAGVSVGLALLLFRDVVHKAIFPKLSAINAYRLLRLLITLSFSLAVMGIAAWAYVAVHPPPTIALPGGSAWVLLGDYDLSGRILTMKKFELVRSNYPDRSLVPRKDEIVQLTDKRRAIITDFRTSGVTKLFEPPWKPPHVFSDDTDDTGIVLPSGTRLEVRDVTVARDPQLSTAVIWARVAVVGE